MEPGDSSRPPSAKRALARGQIPRSPVAPLDAARARLDASVLEGLAQGMPYPAFVFDTDGRALWVTQAGRERVLASESTLEELSAIALAACEDDPGSLERPWLPSGHRLRVVRVPGNRWSPDVVVVMCEPAREALPRSGAAADPSLDPGLSPRELEVAAAVGRGESVAALSARLGIKVGTVRIHLKKAYAKLGVANRAQLAVRMAELEGRAGTWHRRGA